MSHRGWSYTDALIKATLSLSTSFHKISRYLVSVRPLPNLAKVGQETRVLWGAADWQTVWSYKPCFLGNHAKTRHIKALPLKCVGCVRSRPEMCLPVTIHEPDFQQLKIRQRRLSRHRREAQTLLCRRYILKICCIAERCEKIKAA